MSHPVPWSFNEVQQAPDNSGIAASVYIIAEIGVNHDGNVDTARKLIDAAKSAGADAIKLQIFRAQSLVNEVAALCGYQQRALNAIASQQSMLQQLELAHNDMIQLRRYAAEIEIDFLATPFGIDDLRFLTNELEPIAVKIASPDLVNVPLLESAIESALPLIVSTGASNQNEIDACVSMVRAANASERTALLHCVSAYPTPITETRLGLIRYLSARCNLSVGFSDHTTELETGAMAVCAGARILERHLTYDRSAEGPDHPMSTTPENFQTYVNSARQAASIMSSGPRRCAPIETDVRKLARSRIVATVDIPAGTILTAQHLHVQRPGDGICPSQWHSILGQTTTQSIAAGGPLHPSCLTNPTVTV